MPINASLVRSTVSRISGAAVVALLLAALRLTAAAAEDAPDPDACALAHSDEVQALLATPDTVIGSHSSHPLPGESKCVWAAREKGLTDNAPPYATLTLEFYHFASAAKAQAQMRHFPTPPGPPRLSQTDNPGDEVIHADHVTTIAYDGANVVVASEVAPDPVWDKPGWTYHLEAMALRAAGSHVLGPADPTATADVCHLIAPPQVLGLLTLTRSTLEAQANGGRRCSFAVKDASGKIDGWVNNNGEANFEREDLGNHAAAIARLHADTPFFPESHLVLTADPTDVVVPNPQHPEEVSAVHGPYLVRLHVENVTPAARAAPGWTSRVERAALEVAGATVPLQPGLPPDPVVPGPKPKPERFAWHPAAHVAPAGSAALAPLLHVFWKLAEWRFLVLPASIVLSLLAVFILKFRRLRIALLLPLAIGYGVLNMMFGTYLGVLLIDHFGTQAQATIVGTFATSTQYNNHDVVGYNVLIRTPDGKIVETNFEDDDFNVYPPHNTTTYPGQGAQFTVRYPPGFPQDFVIVGDDDSPWAMQQRCSRLEAAADEADQKQNFAPGSPSFSTAAAAAHGALRVAGCDTEPDTDDP